MIRNNPFIGDAFKDAAGTEVSIFWIDANGMRKKARIDCLKFAADVDLKSEGNMMGDPFPVACRKSIARYGYHIQAAHYMDARKQLAGFLKAGAIHGEIANEVQFVAAAKNTQTAFVFVFMQKTEAPLSWGTMISPGSPMLEIARASIDQAERNWTVFVDKFGLDTPWIVAEPLRELAIEEMPGWFGRI